MACIASLYAHYRTFPIGILDKKKTVAALNYNVLWGWYICVSVMGIVSRACIIHFHLNNSITEKVFYQFSCVCDSSEVSVGISWYSSNRHKVLTPTYLLDCIGVSVEWIARIFSKQYFFTLFYNFINNIYNLFIRIQLNLHYKRFTCEILIQKKESLHWNSVIPPFFCNSLDELFDLPQCIWIPIGF